MKKLMVMMAVAMLMIVSGCATQLGSTSTVKELDAKGNVTKQTDTKLNYMESNLAHKSLAAGGAVTALKVVTAADPNTGSFMPTFILGFGTFFMFDLPSNVSAYFHDTQKSMWTAEVGSETIVYIQGSDNGQKVEISNPALIVDLPFIKVQNPVADSGSTKIIPNAVKGMGTMPEMPKMK